MKRPWGFLGYALVLLVLNLVPLGANGDDKPPEELLVRLVHFSLTESQLQIVDVALRSHLSELRVGLEMVPGTLETESDKSRSQYALSTAATADIVTWFDKAQSRFFIYSPDIDQQVKTVTFGDMQQSWTQKCEVMGAAVGSEAKWIAEDSQGAAVVPLDGQNSSTKTEEVTPVAKREDQMSGAIEVGYAPVLMSKDGPYLNGASLGFALTLHRYVGIEFSGWLGERAAVNTTDDTGNYSQTNLRLRLAGRLPLGTVDMGLRAGPVFHLWRIRDLDNPNDTSVQNAHFKAGIAGAVTVHYKPVRWFSLYLEAGADVYFKETKYVEDDETRLGQSALQLRAVAGVGLTLF